jgi:hypothetical protein
MITSKDLEKEVELAEDLQGKLDKIEGVKPRKARRKKEVSQDIVTPYDKVVDSSFVTQLDNNKKIVEEIQNRTEQQVDVPDPTKHKYVSFVKSGIRIIAGGCLITGNLLMAGVCLIMAEILGIVEELV